MKRLVLTQYICSKLVLFCSVWVQRPSSTRVSLTLADWLLAGVCPSSFNTLRIVARGYRVELLGGGMPEEWWHRMWHNEGRNGASSQARKASLHAFQTTKLEVRKVWKVWKSLGLWLIVVFHDTRRNHANLARLKQMEGLVLSWGNEWNEKVTEKETDGERRKRTTL